ncbi:MAG: FAD-dependent oxidoreductase [Bacteroidota bacterium]
MNRKDFLKMCGILGVGIPFQSTLTSCNNEEGPSTSDVGKVIIIGAGAGGLTAGYLLNQRGIEFEILEASSVYGGRMRTTRDFADFPISLGGEWLHVEKGVLSEIVNDPSVQINVETTPYDLELDYGLFEGQQISVEDVGFTIDQKFIGSSWFDFYEEYVVPSVRSKITYNTIIDSIDYSSDQIRVRTADQEFVADRVIVAVPVKILQNGAITFTPELPADKRDAITNVTVWDGCKAFIEFSQKFYPTFVAFDIQPESAGQKLYYDAAYGQNTNQNILGLFAVGTGTLPYVQLSDAQLIDYVLAELDDIFDGQASSSYVKHIFQNWNEEPFANGAYIYDNEDWRRLRKLGESISGKLYFAGDAYTTGDDWSSVHAAARSAKRAIEELVS